MTMDNGHRYCRKRVEKTSYPVLHWKSLKENECLFSYIMKESEKIKEKYPKSPDRLIKMNGSEISVLYLHTLKPGRWLNDKLIDSLINTFMNISYYKNNITFGRIDSLIINIAISKQRRQSLVEIIYRDLDFVVDIVLWPIFKSRHWILCYADVHSKRIQIIDPYCPSIKSMRVDKSLEDSISFILSVYTDFKKKYFDPDLKWKLDMKKYISSDLG